MLKLSPIGWALRPLKKYAQFSGRAPRAEFWWFMLFFLLGYMVLLGIGIAVSAGGRTDAAASSPLGFYTGMGAFLGVIGIYWLGLLVPTLAVTVRRLHDINRSGWWLGAYVLLYIAYVALLMGLGRNSANMGLAVIMMVMSLAFLAYAVTLLVFYCLPGTRGPNRYGDDPYGADVEQVFA